MSKRVVHSCPFVPAEWIAAHGLEPVRIMPESAAAVGSVGPVPGVCPYARAFVNTALWEGDAAVLTTACDQMRRAAELIEGLPVFLLNVPHTWQSKGSFELYLGEVRRLGRFLVGLGGAEPTADALSAVMRNYDAERARTRAAIGRAAPRGIPIALVGGPMFADHVGIFDLIEQAGGYVALDATETGERTMISNFDWDKLGNDPLRLLAETYFRDITDPFRRPNTPFYDWLGERIRERKIRGIILRRYLWCDIWHAEAERIKEQFGLPFVHIDVGDSATDAARTLTRLQTFMELLK